MKKKIKKFAEGGYQGREGQKALNLNELPSLNLNTGENNSSIGNRIGVPNQANNSFNLQRIGVPNQANNSFNLQRIGVPNQANNSFNLQRIGGLKKGGKVKAKKPKDGRMKKAKCRDGIAQRGKTKGKMV
jgi:hypothetical protein